MKGALKMSEYCSVTKCIFRKAGSGPTRERAKRIHHEGYINNWNWLAIPHVCARHRKHLEKVCS